MTSLYHLSNFDIFSPEEYIIEYTKIYLGKDIIKHIISNIYNANYKGYLNNKTIQIIFIFDNKNRAFDFFEILNTYDLNECFNNNRFYLTIQDVMLITNNLSLNIESKIINKKDTKLFKPCISDNKVYLNIPNNKLAYIHLYNIDNEVQKSILNLGDISEYASIYLSQQLTSGNFIIKSSIIEKETFEGNRAGSFSIIDNDLYFVCDIGLHLLHIIEKAYIDILKTNNQIMLDNYCNSNKEKFNKFKNQILNN